MFQPAISTDIPGVADRDTTFNDHEYSWRGLVLQYPMGKVYIEEDFEGMGTINRIRIETPELKLKNGIKTGDTVKQLRAASAKWTITALADYKLFDFYSTAFPQIHFLVSEPVLTLNLMEYKIGMFDTEDPVVGIVVF